MVLMFKWERQTIHKNLHKSTTKLDKNKAERVGGQAAALNQDGQEKCHWNWD